jgi:hypothetical protein
MPNWQLPGHELRPGAAVVDFSERHCRILFEWINGDADESISPNLTEASMAKSLPAGERKPPLLYAPGERSPRS